MGAMQTGSACSTRDVGALRTQLWDYAHGRDPREVEPSGARKTVGCEINYGVRFDGQADADRFVDELAVQVGLFC